MSVSGTGGMSRALSSVGLVLLLTSATVGVAFFGAGSWLTLVPAGAGAVALGAGLALGARRVDKARLRGACELALLAVAVVAVNMLALRSSALVDVTSSQKNTLAEASVHVARTLHAPVVVEAALDPADRAFTDLTALIERYQRYTRAPNDISVVRVDAAARSIDDAKVRLRSGDRVHKVRFVAGAPDQEQVITNALRAVTNASPARAYVVAAEGLPSVGDEGASGLRRFGQALADEGLDVVPLPLHAVERVPDDAAFVVVPGELAAADAAQAKKLDGARMLVLLEPPAAGLDGAVAALIGGYGIQANRDVIVDTSAFSGVLGGPDTATGVAYASHPATAKLGASLTHFSRARSLAENPIDGVVVTALVQTGTEAYGEVNVTSAPGLDAADTKGPMTIAMAAQRDKERIVVVGDASFVTNAGIGLGANAELAVHMALWLADKEDAILVRPRGRGGNLLLLSPTARERIAFVLLYGLPVALLATGLTVRALRRR